MFKFIVWWKLNVAEKFDENRMLKTVFNENRMLKKGSMTVEFQWKLNVKKKFVDN